MSLPAAFAPPDAIELILWEDPDNGSGQEVGGRDKEVEGWLPLIKDGESELETVLATAASCEWY